MNISFNNEAPLNDLKDLYNLDLELRRNNTNAAFKSLQDEMSPDLSDSQNSPTLRLNQSASRQKGNANRVTWRQDKKSLALLLGLYFAQGLIITFFAVTIPDILSSQTLKN